MSHVHRVGGGKVDPADRTREEGVTRKQYLGGLVEETYRSRAVSWKMKNAPLSAENVERVPVFISAIGFGGDTRPGAHC